MITLAHIAPRSGTVTFPTPLYGKPELVEMPSQHIDHDSDGAVYVYGKARAARFNHRLSWQAMTKADLDSLLLFYEVSTGCKYDFRWTDHLDIPHPVRFPPEQISYRQAGPDRWTVEIGLEETARLVLVDEVGNTLIDESGNEITW